MIPPRDPAIILVAPNKVIIGRAEELAKVNSRRSGVIFCQVDNKRHSVQDIEFITLGNQK